MKTKNELFLEAVDYLIDEGLATDQGDLAQKAGLGPNLISRVRNGRVKSVSDDSIRALASKFNLNMHYFRGKSEYITRYDQASANLDYELKEAQRLLDKDPFAPSPQPIDQSSLVNAALAAKDETIAALRSQLADLRIQLVASFYCISPATDWHTDVTVAARSADDATIAAVTIPDVPFRRNSITEYSGTIFSAGRSVSIEVDDSWGDPISGTW